MRKFALALILVLALPAAASAHIYVLSQSQAPFNATTFTYSGQAPLEGGSLGFKGPLPARWFRSTIAWNSVTNDVLVGCRGHGSAQVKIRVGHRMGSTVCDNHERWHITLDGVSKKDHIQDSTLIKTVGRT